MHIWDVNAGLRRYSDYAILLKKGGMTHGKTRGQKTEVSSNPDSVPGRFGMHRVFISVMRQPGPPAQYFGSYDPTAHCVAAFLL
jgi:hypothetical protein